MSTHRFPDQPEDTPPAAKPVTWQTKATIAAAVLVLAVVIALHVAHVFG